MGANVIGNENSFITHPVMDDIEQLAELKLDKENPWYQKYIEFSHKLTQFAEGRFPVGQPILRGVTDTVGALVGQTELIYGLIDEPELMAKAFDVVVDAQRELLASQLEVIEPFHGGHSFGFYHLWTPGKVIWYQEDAAALMSPSQYEEFLYHTSSRYIKGYDYSLVHLHPASFFHLDGILSLSELTAVQVNKDTAGPTIRDMVPQCLKILESGKKLVLGMSRMDTDDIDAIYNCLPNTGIELNIIAEDPKEANELLEYMATKKR